ncbi:MAG TPA: hypothetical protein VG757_14040 [Devosia sp.]|nr:hypothetical protein [Devosia sp.]
MPVLRVPSVQHLARNWRASETAVARLLVQLALNPPFFNYSPLYSAARDLLILKVPYDQVLTGIQRIKRKVVRDNLAEVVPLMHAHFEDISPDYFQLVDRRYYPVGRDLMVPFDPPLIYGLGGTLHFPWFSFWRQNPLQNEALSLFVTLVSEILLQDPDLEGAKFEILDFSCIGSDRTRALQVIDAAEIPRVSDDRKAQMLEVFAAGYALALQELRSKARSSSREADAAAPSGLQGELFEE